MNRKFSSDNVPRATSEPKIQTIDEKPHQGHDSFAGTTSPLSESIHPLFYEMRFLEEIKWNDPAVRTAWASLLDRGGNGGTFHQSPSFFDYLAKRHKNDVSLVAVSDVSRSLVGVVPLHVTETTLEFTIGSRRLAKLRIRAALILGHCPLMPSISSLYDELFLLLSKRFLYCDVIELNAVPTTSNLWQCIQDSKDIRGQYYVYIPYGPRPCHTSPLPETFDEYVESYSGKKRYNLKRQLKLLREQGGGVLQLRRLESSDDLPVLFDWIEQILPSHQVRSVLTRETAEMLTNQGMLLCYVLVCGSRACAIAIGARFRDKYALHATAYHQSFRQFSPGTSLQYLLVEDLLRNRLARYIDFGYGEPAGPYRSTNVIEDRGTVLLFRKSFANRVRIGAHSLFHGLARRAKRLIGTANGGWMMMIAQFFGFVEV